MPIGAAGRASEYKGGLTGAVIFVAIIAASGGLLFGGRGGGRGREGDGMAALRSVRDGASWYGLEPAPAACTPPTTLPPAPSKPIRRCAPQAMTWA